MRRSFSMATVILGAAVCWTFSSLSADEPLAVQVQSDDTVNEAVADSEVVAWQPSLRVRLTTEAPISPNATPSFPSLDAFSPASARRTSSSVVTLACDDVQITVSATGEGQPKYSFSCEGRFVLTMGSTTVSGLSVTSENGILVAKEARISTEGGVSLSAEKLELKIPVTAVSVEEIAPIPEAVLPDSNAGFAPVKDTLSFQLSQ